MNMDQESYKKFFYHKEGIEIGGPSGIFVNDLPVYQFAKRVDGCNYSPDTIWGNGISEGRYVYHDNKSGTALISEASDLIGVSNEKYDFLLACHCLEHCANTLKTMKEWLRVLKIGGALLIVVPDKRFTFDHMRSVTEFTHLMNDYHNNVGENDMSHFEAIVSQHDLSLDKGAGTMEEFVNRSKDNFRNRCLHHHVFDFNLLHSIFDYFKIKVVETGFFEPYHQVIIGVKL